MGYKKDSADKKKRHETRYRGTEREKINRKTIKWLL